MVITLENIQQFSILSGNDIYNINFLTVTGENTIINGNVGYSNITYNESSNLNIENGEVEHSTNNYFNAIFDLNRIISEFGIINYQNITNSNIGNMPLSPGNYLFENHVEFISTLYLIGNGTYIFYLKGGITIGDVPIEGYMDLSNGALSDDIYFYSPYDIIFGGNNNSTLYGNFISDLNIEVNTINYNISGRLLTSTGNISINQVQINNQDIACYLEGTKILMGNNEYKLIENINKNDMIMIYGIIKNNIDIELFDQPQSKKICFFCKINIKNIYNKNCPIYFDKESLGKVPFEKLGISPQHRIIYNDKFLIAKNLVNLNGIYKSNTINKLSYYHLECEEHYIIKANGVLSETLLDFNNDFKNKLEKIF